MEAFQILEQQKDTPLKLTCNLRDPTISRDEMVIANYRVEPPVFTAFGKARFAEEERQRVGSVH